MSNDAGEFSIRAMCKAFGLARSADYRWQSQGCSTRQTQADMALTEQIRRVFERSEQTYDAPRMHAELKAQGGRCSRRRVARMMRSARLNAKPPCRRAPTTQADGQPHAVGNLLAQHFTADSPD